jgi:hypothetical protein
MKYNFLTCAISCVLWIVLVYSVLGMLTGCASHVKPDPTCHSWAYVRNYEPTGPYMVAECVLRAERK